MSGNPHARALHASPHLGVFHTTGGGVSLLADLLGEPGASNTVLQASVPYAEAALADCLGGLPDQACSADTARALAMAGWQRAQALTKHDKANARTAVENLFGFGCTAALATNRPKRGGHRAYLAVQTLHTTASAHIEFDKGKDGMGDREAEEAQLTALAWQLLERVLDVHLSAPAVADTSTINNLLSNATPAWSRLLSGQSVVEGIPTTQQRPKALLSGSFNPLHQGHLAMAEHAAKALGTKVAFEVCIDNVDKPALGYFDLEQRCEQFSDRQLWLTRAPTFVQKAREFPGSTFVLGIDTLVRIGMPRYYESSTAMHAAFAEMQTLGNHFLVFGRAAADSFVTLTNSQVPEALRALCTGVSETDFRIDVSSSELRKESEVRFPF